MTRTTLTVAQWSIIADALSDRYRHIFSLRDNRTARMRETIVGLIETLEPFIDADHVDRNMLLSLTLDVRENRHIQRAVRDMFT